MATKKGMKQVSVAMSKWDFDGDIEYVINNIRQSVGDLTDAEIRWSHWNEPYVLGWRPMTEAELRRAEARKEKAKAAAAAKKAKVEAREQKELARLYKKYGVPDEE